MDSFPQLVAQKYAYMHAQGVMLSFSLLDDGFCEVKYQQLTAPTVDYFQKSQLSLGVIYRIMNELCGFKWRAHKLIFKQDVHQEDKLFFQQFFNCDIEFNAKLDALYFHSDFLKQKPIVHEELTSEIIAQQFAQQKE